MRIRVCLGLLLLAASPPRLARARQVVPSVPVARVGDTVRVRTVAGPIFQGVLTLSARDSVVIRDAGAQLHAFRSDLVRDIEAQRVVPTWSRARWGALTGAALGFVIPYAQTRIRGAYEHCTTIAGNRSCSTYSDNADGEARLGALIGAVVGSGVGIVIPWHHWERARFDLMPPSVVAPSP
jgi:hypothetical protein